MIGQAPGHFRILEEIGSGGMGVVYRGVDVRLGRPVAIKVLQQGALADAERRERFAREARAASALNHPNIVTIYEIGSEAGVDFIAMELIEGQSLRKALGPGEVPMRAAVSYGIETARALAAAHEKGIVHRDLKPENLLITKEGRIKVLDFGLAKLVRDDERVAMLSSAPTSTLATKPGTILGTVGYMSPEQVRGRPVDRRSDIFSFGAILYEMLTGCRAFKADSHIETLNAILTQDPLKPAGAGRSLPPGLERVVSHCLEKNPQNRFESARDVALALEAISQAPGTKPASLASRLWTAPMALGLAAAILALTGLGIAIFWERRAGGAEAEAIRSIAVLPFQNLSGDPEQEYFTDGMTDALIGTLAKIGALRVISRTSAMRYKGAKTSLPQVGSELNVEAVVEGSVLWSGDRVRISAQGLPSSER